MRQFILSLGLRAGLAAGAMVLAAPVSQAALIISVQSGSYNAGTNGDALDVLLQNTGPSSFDIAGFAFGLSVSTPNLTFTGVNISTGTPYIFAGHSLFGPDITVSVTPQAVSGQDIHDTNFTTVASGATFGLGHVIFNLDPGTPTGPINVVLTSAASSLTDSGDNSLAFQLTDGIVTVQGTGAPEPASMMMVLVGMAGALLVRRRAC